MVENASGDEGEETDVGHADTRSLVADEPTSALDASVRAQIVNLLSDLEETLGISFVSDRIVVMYLGEVVEYGPAADVFDAPARPCAPALLDAFPAPDPAREANRKIELIAGE